MALKKALRVGDHTTYQDHTPSDDSSARFFEYRVAATISHSGLEFRYEQAKENL
jgi:hypothetical protein